MAGNVWEWVADGYDSDYYENSSYRNPTGPSSSLGDDGREWRTVRGGSWDDVPRRVRSAFRLKYDPTLAVYNVGFRVLVEVE